MVRQIHSSTPQHQRREEHAQHRRRLVAWHHDAADCVMIPPPRLPPLRSPQAIGAESARGWLGLCSPPLCSRREPRILSARMTTRLYATLVTPSVASPSEMAASFSDEHLERPPTYLEKALFAVCCQQHRGLSPPIAPRVSSPVAPHRRSPSPPPPAAASSPQPPPDAAGLSTPKLEVFDTSEHGAN